MLVRIDPTSDIPIFDQVAGSIRADMVAGTIRPGDKLAPARELAAGLDVNLHTVLRAYQLWRDEGLVDMRRGRGGVRRENTLRRPHGGHWHWRARASRGRLSTVTLL